MREKLRQRNVTSKYTSCGTIIDSDQLKDLLTVNGITIENFESLTQPEAELQFEVGPPWKKDEQLVSSERITLKCDGRKPVLQDMKIHTPFASFEKSSIRGLFQFSDNQKFYTFDESEPTTRITYYIRVPSDQFEIVSQLVEDGSDLALDFAVYILSDESRLWSSIADASNARPKMLRTIA